MGWNDLVKQVQGAAMTTFAETFTWQPAAGGSYEIEGIFRESGFEQHMDTGLMVRTQEPRMDVLLSDLPAAPVKGDQLTHAGRTFEVYDHEEDSQGIVALMLHEL